MTDVFISYSRKDRDIVEKLNTALANENRDVWVDWEDIPRGSEWLKEIFEGIDNADTFVFVVSEHSLTSEICNHELHRAISNNKRIIPLIRTDIDSEKEKVLVGEWYGYEWEQIARTNWKHVQTLNWIFFREQDVFDVGFRELLEALESDQEYTKRHTKILVRAREWENQGKDPSRLLKGTEISEAQAWLLVAEDKSSISPKPTELQIEYIQASQTAERIRQRRIYTVGLSIIVAMAILLLLSITLYFSSEQQRELANNNAATANAETNNLATANAEISIRSQMERSQQLAAQALSLSDSHLDLALLLSVEANRLAPSTDFQRSTAIEGVLLSNLQRVPELSYYLHGHVSGIMDISFSDGGSRLISVDRESILVWHVDERQPADLFSIGPTSAVDINPAGTLVAVGLTNPPGVSLIDISAAEVTEYSLADQLDDIVRSLAFSPDGETLASGSCRERLEQTCNQGLINLWNVESGQLTTQLFADDSDIHELVFSPDGRYLVSGGNRVIVWDLATGQPAAQGEETGYISSLSISPDGEMLVSGDFINISLWEMYSNQPSQQLPLGVVSHAYNSAGAVAFHPRMHLFFTGHSDGTIRMWNLDGEPVGQPLSGHAGSVTSLAFSPDGRLMISGGDDDRVLGWNLEYEQVLGHKVELGEDVGRLDSLVFSPDGNYLAADAITEILLFEYSDNYSRPRYIPFTGGYTGGVIDLAFSPDGTELYALETTSNENEEEAHTILSLRDVLSGQAVREPITLDTEQDIVSSGFSPNGQTLITFHTDRSGQESSYVNWWDLRTGDLVDTYQFPTNYTNPPIAINAAFSSSAQMLAFNAFDDIYLFDLLDHHQVHDDSLDGHEGPVYSLALDQSGQHLVSGGYDGVVNLWDISTGRRLLRAMGHEDSVYSAVLSPNNQIIATGSEDTNVILWDASSGQRIGDALRGHSGIVNALAFHPDGSILVSSSYDQSMIVWQIGVDVWIRLACQIANRNLTFEEWNLYIGEDEYRPTCPSSPGASYAYYQQGKAQFATVNFEEAIAYFTLVIDSIPNFYPAIVARGQSYLGLQDYAEAVDDFNRAIELNPDVVSTYFSRGLAYYNQNENKLAIADFTRLIDTGGDAAAYHWRGWAYYQDGEYELAISDFEQSLEMQPDYSGAFNGLAWSYFSLENYQEAITNFGRAISLYPEYTDAYIGRGRAFYELEDYSSSVEDFQQALDLNPQDASVHRRLGWAYFMSGEYEQAATGFEQAIQHDHIPPSWPYHGLGRVYYALGEFDQAHAYFTQAIELDADYLAAYLWRGWTSWELGETESAISDFNRVIEIDEGYANAYHGLGWVYDSQEDYDRAIEYFNLAIAHGQDPISWPYFGLGQVYFEVGDYERAEEYFIRAKAEDQEYIPALKGLGWTYYVQGHYTEAQGEFLAALALQPEDANLHYWVAVTSLALNDPKAALVNLQDYRELTQNFDNSAPPSNAIFWQAVAYHMMSRDEDADEHLADLERSALLTDDTCTQNRLIAKVELFRGNEVSARQHYLLIFEEACGQRNLQFEIGYLRQLSQMYPSRDDFQAMFEWYDSQLNITMIGTP